MRGNDEPTSGKSGSSGNPTNLTFGPRLRQERLSRDWALKDLAARTGYDTGQLSRIENSRRPPTAALAIACDRAMPELGGWFSANFEVNIQALERGVAVGGRWLRFSGGRGVAVVAVRDFRDDCGL